MFTNKNEKIYAISAKLTTVDVEFAKAYIKGAVHSFCNNNPNQRFSVRTLFGGQNSDWSNTPLEKIYQYHRYIAPKSDPAEAAAKDVGWLLKAALKEDKRRSFEVVDGYTKEYMMTDTQ